MRYSKDISKELWDQLAPPAFRDRPLWKHLGLFFQWLVSSGDRWNASFLQILRALAYIRSIYETAPPLEEDWEPLSDSGNLESRLALPAFRVYQYLRELGVEWAEWIFPSTPREPYFSQPWQPTSQDWLESKAKPYLVPYLFQILREYPRETFFEKFVKIWGYRLRLAYPRYKLYETQYPTYAPSVSDGLEQPYDPDHPPLYGYGNIALYPDENAMQSRPVFYLGDGVPSWVWRKVGGQYVPWLEPGNLYAYLEVPLEGDFSDPAPIMSTLQDFLEHHMPISLGIRVFPLLVVGESLVASQRVEILENGVPVDVYTA